MRRAPVYDLIKTLSTAEVKKMTKRCESADAAYGSLLRIMHGSAKKDEALFKKEFAAIHPQVDYTETKSYLYKFLLRHLTEWEHEQNVFTEVNYAFVTAELLLNRGLKQEAYTIFKSAKTKADEAGFYQLSIVALKRMQNICFSTSRTDKDYALIHQLGLEEADAREKDKAASISLQLYIRFLHLIEKHGAPPHRLCSKPFRK
ncbi:MAG: hypothetical protein IPN22_06500 [Bacteroidetes bacterium]|nr:hypothetical protein [Bacteroidota bacterium]